MYIGVCVRTTNCTSRVLSVAAAATYVDKPVHHLLSHLLLHLVSFLYITFLRIIIPLVNPYHLSFFPSFSLWLAVRLCMHRRTLIMSFAYGQIHTSWYGLVHTIFDCPMTIT